jgi:hypothetical protein
MSLPAGATLPSNATVGDKYLYTVNGVVYQCFATNTWTPWASPSCWGAIGGTLADQADLSSAVDAKLAKASNLSDLASASSARTNLGLGTLATQSGTFSGTTSGTNTGDQTTVSGNAGTATALQTARAINGVSFNGTADITVTAAAGTVTGTTLASGVTASSLTSFGAAAAFVTSAAITSSGTAGIGYATGAGGTVTQLTSKSTGVTLSKLCGTITTHNASLNAATIVTFTVTNTLIAATDVPCVIHDSGGTVGAYTVMPNTSAAGSFKISLRNNTAGALGEALVLRFVIVKAVTA